MANTLTEVTPKLLAQGLLALRENSIMALLVNRDYEAEAAQKGSTVDVPIPSAIATQDVAPGATPPSTADISPTSVAIPLDQWKEAPFYLTDKDMLTAMDGTIPMQASEAVKSLANTGDLFILGLYKGIYGFNGSPGTTPFASDTTDATASRTTLNKQLAPMTDRRFVIDPDAEGNALNLRAFQDMSFSGSAQAILEGNIGRKLGFAWFMDQNVVSHTAGSLTGTIVTDGASALGATTITLATDAAEAVNLLEGDIVTFAGDTQTYVLTADATIGASTTGNITIDPGLKVAHSGGEEISVKATHVVNLAFHRDAFAFAMRPLQDAAEGLGNVFEQATDPVSGLSLRLEVSREHKRTRFSYDILYGGALVRAALATRLAG